MRYFVGEVRSERGMSVRQLAERSHISKSYLQRIEAGEVNPSLKVMVQIARALGVPLDKLYQYD